ncbi:MULTISPECIES: helix-turn-helix domain-containing protein [Myroides]|uniref:helix-turn-helix domain-containing protein n=1 Tax=Myroides TaxID=76831 RepID=UPI002DB9E2BA|nr:helix-turn-helix transcriptional regulator [Myroides odoratimimus]MEC4041906.1 helix-turn-helix transcriptional regulator [Myroides odoratimimus]MEC4149862.1 helix-turn-helix transcriptional regulator [Myroides odoratimimus]
MTTATRKHIGKNISRIREIKGMKQITLAELLGVSQQQVSIIENSESVEDSKLENIAKILEVPIDAIKEYSDDKVMNIINSTITDSPIYNNFCTFNPLDKLIEAHEENKKLYERLLEAEKEKIAYLEKMLSKK